MNESEHSVSLWIDRLKAGDTEAANALWSLYAQRLLDVARWKLGHFSRRTFDEEDVVISVFDSLCRGAKKGRFPRLTDRNDLWRLLLVISHQKATDRKRHESRKKRGGPRGPSSLSDAAAHEDDCLHKLLSEDPTPDRVALIHEQHDRLLELLGDDMLRKIAIGKMQGYTTTELAHRLDVAGRTIQRKVRLIQSMWADQLEQSGLE